MPNRRAGEVGADAFATDAVRVRVDRAVDEQKKAANAFGQRERTGVFVVREFAVMQTRRVEACGGLYERRERGTKCDVAAEAKTGGRR